MRPWLFIPFILLGCQWAEDETTRLTIDLTPNAECSAFRDNKIRGKINDSMYLCEYDPTKKVLINSSGGVIYSAYVLGDYFEEDDVTLRVDGECSSACILLLTSENRQACKDSIFRLHEASSENGTQLMVNELKKDERVDWQTIEALMRRHPFGGRTFHVLFPEEAMAVGLIDTIKECS